MQNTPNNNANNNPTTAPQTSPVQATPAPAPESNTDVNADNATSTANTTPTPEAPAPNVPATGTPALPDTDAQSIDSDSMPAQPTTANNPSVDNVHNDTTTNQAPVSASQHYAIDTVAYNLSSFRSMVFDNSGNVYYINGDTISRTNSNHTLSLSTSFEIPLKNAYLAHDPFNNVVYLLAGPKDGSLAIYDITNMSSPCLVLDKTSCPALPGSLTYTSSVVPQIAALKDGSLLVPIDLDGTHRINPTTKQVTRFSRLYDFSSPYYAKLVGNNIIKFRGGDKTATVIPVTGGSEYSITLTDAAPSSVVFSNESGVFYYEDEVGLCRISIDGQRHIEIPQDDIRIDDYQTLDRTNIWSLAVSKNGSVAFYDNTLGCIRCIRPLN